MSLIDTLRGRLPTVPTAPPPVAPTAPPSGSGFDRWRPNPTPPPPAAPTGTGGGVDETARRAGNVTRAQTDPYSLWQDLIQGRPGTVEALTGMESELGQYGIKVLRNASGVAGKIQLPDGTIVDVLNSAGLGGRGWQWLTGDGGNGGGPGGGSGGTVFDDPATREWEELIRKITAQLMTPQPLGYTDSQKELMLTQSLDPMTRQRDAQRQQTLERLAQRGISASSGIAQDALAEVDRQYTQQRTQTQAGFATGQINLEDQRRQLNEARMLQALQAFTGIPNRADSRLSLAQGTMYDPSSLINSLMGIWNQQNQGSQYNQQQRDAWLQQLYAGLFGPGGLYGGQ